MVRTGVRTDASRPETSYTTPEDMAQRRLRCATTKDRSGETVAISLGMCYACENADCMKKMIQIRNVPEAVHRKLKARAACAGMSLSDYLRVAA